ncbi:MAG: alpha/beta hydrolase [Pseudomonadota bacterium]
MSLTRRTLIAASVAGLAAGKAARGNARPRESLTFVCVPGTWHGGWVWTPLAEALRRRGHRCFRVTCTGVGERAHLISPEVGLDTHARDVTQVIRYEALERVVLVGHSFAGVTITEVADRLAGSGRIAALLYYDAFIPTPARPAWVMRDEAGEWPEWWRDRQSRFVDGYKMDFASEYPIRMLVDPEATPELARSVAKRLTHHPARQWTEAASFANGGWRDYPRAYVHCTGQAYRQSSSAMFGPAKAPGWQFETSDTVRLGMLSAPDDTAALFERIGHNLLATST